MVQLTLWRCCLLTPSEPGTSLWIHNKPQSIQTAPARSTYSSQIPLPVTGCFKKIKISIPVHSCQLPFSCSIFCIVSPEKVTFPWWPGSAAPDWRCAGSTGSRTNQCSACAKPPQGHVLRWAAITWSILVIWKASAVIYTFNRVLYQSQLW